MSSRGRGLLAALAACALSVGCEGPESLRDEPPTRPSLGDLESYRGQRPLLEISSGFSDDPFKVVVFGNGLVLGEVDGCSFLSKLQKRRLSPDEMSTLQSFLARIPRQERSYDCTGGCHPIPYYYITWTLDGESQTLSDTCGGRYEPEVGETARKLLDLVGMGTLIGSCDWWAHDRDDRIIGQLLGWK